MLSIITLLECPNPDDPLEADIARLMETDGLKFWNNAKMATAKFATDNNVETEKSDEEEEDYSDEETE